MTAHATASSSNASLANVAAMAGVSTATVSRVLSGKRTKNDDIAHRVRTAASKLDYSVNYAASALRSTVTRTIGLIIPSASDPFSAQLIDTLEPLITVSGKQLVLGTGTTQEMQRERIDLMAARHVDGVIIVALDGGDTATIANRYARKVPMVQIGDHDDSLRSPQVIVAQSAIVQIAAEALRLLALKPDSLAHVTLPSHSVADENALAF